MAALVTSIVLFLIGIGVVQWIGRHRRPGTPITWAEAVLGAVLVFGLLLLAYGVIPNSWLLMEQNEWKWRADAIAYVVKFWGRGQVIITKQAIGDIVATVIYVVMLGLNIALWSQWQKRGRAREERPAIETSTFGRPLVRKA
jgi:hypothetical protein